MGIGSVPDAALSQLTNHKNLGIHTEMFSVSWYKNLGFNQQKWESYWYITHYKMVV